MYLCLWDLCKFETDDNNEITRHIKYHTYHTRIKAQGKAFRDQYFIQHCSADSMQRNKLPVLKSDFSCQWAGCGLSFNCIQVRTPAICCASNYIAQSEFASEPRTTTLELYLWNSKLSLESAITDMLSQWFMHLHIMGFSRTSSTTWRATRWARTSATTCTRATGSAVRTALTRRTASTPTCASTPMRSAWHVPTVAPASPPTPSTGITARDK